MAILDLVFLTVALLGGAQSIRMPSVISDAPKLLLLSFDGFRYDYLDRPVLKPNFDFAINKGVRAKYMKSTFATKTDPNHMTMVTGLWEESHGVVSNKMYDPKYREIFWMNSSDPKWWDGDGRVEPLWITNERKEGRYSGVVNWPGGDVKYGGRLPTYSTGPYNRSIPYTDRIDAMVRWFLDDEKPMNLGLLFFEEPDRSGHLYGPDSPQVDDAIMMIDDTVGYLVSALKEADLYDKVNLILPSDHGMVNLILTSDHGMVNLILTSDHGMVNLILTSDHGMVNLILTSDHGMVNLILTSDHGMVNLILPSDHGMVNLILTSNHGMVNLILTSDHGMVNLILTSDHGMVNLILTSDHGMVNLILTSDHGMVNLILTSDHGMVNLILTSDHGMVEVSPTRVIELNRYIKPEWYIWVDDSPVSAILPKKAEGESA
ncbi:ENPP5 [Branchiostoma lanceolatum]|uniref:ENPP5 protein n=1 Tax=Branchiostoma lanceolatum TaxID=7740 RepID=A0A8J9YLL8_BRALA|nr:ENPP5 [Branchiostoma lanceolatum]